MIRDVLLVLTGFVVGMGFLYLGLANDWWGAGRDG